MSASNAAAEPSMEEILSSIRQAINEDIPGAVPESNADPFASGSSAEAAFSAPPPGQEFDATVHSSHDPFAELTRKLNETRESVQKQMHGVSSNLRSEQPESLEGEPANAGPAPQTQDAQTPPSPAPAAVQTTPAANDEPEPIRAAAFSAEPDQASPEEAPKDAGPSGALQALTARVADQQQAPAEPQGAAEGTMVERMKESPPEAPSSTPAMSGGASGPQVPELSWASAERSAPPAPIVKPAEARIPAPDMPDTPPFASAAAKEPLSEVKPLAEPAFIPKPQAAESAGSTKTDDAMVDLVLRRILEPAVKSWLDDNLPRIVTEVVRDEVRRVANQPN